MLCVHKYITKPSVYAAFLEFSLPKYTTELSGLVSNEISS